MVVSTKLYEMLGVTDTATQGEILRAYRLRARRVHPDKNPDDPTATEKFQHLQKAYELLSDPRRRRTYDKTGCIEEESPDFNASYEHYRNLFATVTVEDIESFEESYKGSEEELEDLIKFYNENEGDISDMFECVILAEAHECDRFLQIFKELISAGRITSTGSFESSSARLPKIAKRHAKKYSKETREARHDLMALEGSTNDVSDMGSLVMAIRGKQKDRMADTSCFLANLEDKYGSEKAVKKQSGPKGLKSKGSKKAPAKGS